MKTHEEIAALKAQFPLRLNWHETVFEMARAGKHTRLIEIVTQKTRGGIDKVKANFRARGVEFPPIEGGHPLAGVTRELWPNSIHMEHVSGLLENGVRIRCHSQSRAEAVEELEGLGGTLDG